MKLLVSLTYSFVIYYRLQPTPISISIKGKKYVTAESDSVEFSITDLIGRAVRSLKPEEVIAQSATRLADDVVVLSKQPLVQKPNEPTTFVLNLGKIKAQYGMYKITLSAGTKSINVNVAVLGEIQVSSLELGIGDVDGTTSPKITTLTYPNKLTEVLHADHLQKYVSFLHRHFLACFPFICGWHNTYF